MLHLRYKTFSLSVVLLSISRAVHLVLAGSSVTVRDRPKPLGYGQMDFTPKSEWNPSLPHNRR